MEPTFPSELKYNISKSVFFDGLMSINPSEPIPNLLLHRRLMKLLLLIGKSKSLLLIMIKSFPVP
jgi:hypothetical protein